MSNQEKNLRSFNGAMMPVPAAMFERDGEPRAPEMPNIGAAMWRYRWAVALPVMLGMLAGFLIFLRTPATYRSQTRLMIESNRPAVMDAITGEVVGGVPSLEIVKSQLFSDEVIQKAYLDQSMFPYRDKIIKDFLVFVEMVKIDECLELEPEVEDEGGGQSVVALLNFDSPNADLSAAAVKAFSTALQDYYNKRYSNTNDELREFINHAVVSLQPELTSLEERQSKFGRENNLYFNELGQPINVHAETVKMLGLERTKLYNDYFKAVEEFQAIKQTVDGSKDPITALAVVSQYLGSDFQLPPTAAASGRAALGVEDVKIAEFDVDTELAPLKAERDSLATELGVGHPQVKILDNQIKSLEVALKQAGQGKSIRFAELMEDEERRNQQARDAVDAVLNAAEIKANSLKMQVANLDRQIADENKQAVTLSQKLHSYRVLEQSIEDQRELMATVNESMSQVRIASGSESETRVIELTQANGAFLVSPILWKLTGIGALLGLTLGAGLAFLLEKNANTFRDPDEIAATLGVPVLTHVPFFKKLVKKAKEGKESPFKNLDPCLAVLHSPSSVVAESIRSLRTSVFFEMSAVNGKVLQLTSPLPGDGKSTLAGNLACAIAQAGKSVLAVDCDLRRPQFTDNFMLQDQLGLTNVLEGECDWREACHSTPLAHLDVMPSGPIPANPAEALTLPEMAELLETLRDHYDYIIIDTPPLLVVTDPSIMASMVDGVLVTVRVRRKSKLNSKESINILRAVGANVLGVIINNSDESSSSDGYRGYGYYRYSRYAKKYYRRGSENAAELIPRGSKKRSGMTIAGRSMTAGRNAASAVAAQPIGSMSVNGSASHEAADDLES